MGIVPSPVLDSKTSWPPFVTANLPDTAGYRGRQVTHHQEAGKLDLRETTGRQLVARFGLVGDLHGRVGFLRLAYEAFERESGVDAVLQVGDFGIDFERLHKDPYMVGDQAEHVAQQHETPLIFTPGNHEGWPELLARPIEPEGYRRIRPHVWMLHGNVMNFHRLRIAALGGATSSDRAARLRHETETGEKVWWPEERVDRDLATALITEAGGEPVDILITHEVPAGLCDDQRPERQGSSESYKRNALIDRLILREVFEALEPRLTVAGHHHVRRTVRPDPAVYRRVPRLEMMGKDGDKFGLAAIWDSETGSILNLVLEV